MRMIIYSNGVSYPLCEDMIESISHIFVTYELARSLWYTIFQWLGYQVVPPSDHNIIFEFFLSLGCRNKSRGDFVMIWHAVVWAI